MDYETLRYEQDGHVVTLTYDRPEQHNAVNRTMNRELHHAWQRFRDDDSAFVLVLTGAGETTFCAGWDLQDAADLDELGDWDAFRVSVMNSPGECGYTRRADIFKPVIAAVNGYAFAAGLETALLADIRIAADDIKIGFNQVTLGIMPAWGGIERLTQLVGRSRAMLAIATGTRYDAVQAQRIGLLDLVVRRAEFEAQWRACAEGFAALAPGATRAIKSVIASFAPAVHDETRDNAIAQFAELWVGDAHWDAVEAMMRR